MDTKLRFPSFESLVEQALASKIPYERIQRRLMYEVMGLERVAAAEHIKKGKKGAPVKIGTALLSPNKETAETEHDHGMYRCFLLKQYQRELPDAVLEKVLRYAAKVRIESISLFRPALREYPTLQRDVVAYLSEDIAYGVIDSLLDAYANIQSPKLRPHALEEMVEHIQTEIFRRIRQRKE